MTLTITKNMDGRRVELIGKYTSDQIDKMNNDFENWKKLDSTKNKYRVQWYNRMLFFPEKHKIVIDFGDYSYFGLIRTNKTEWEKFNNYLTKPTDLEV